MTIDVNVNVLAPIFKGRLMVKGRSVKVGKTICMTEATAEDEEGKIIATGVSKLLASQGLPGIPQALTTSSGDALPPKFL